MGKKTISYNDSASKAVGDINDNFKELYEGAGGAGSSASVATKRVKVYDVMGRAGNGVSSVIYLSANIKAGTEYYFEHAQRGTTWSYFYVRTADANKNILETLIDTSPVVNGFNQAIIPTQDAAYFAVKSYSTGNFNVYHYDDVPTLGKTKWLGKRWLVIGDSISTDHADEAEVGYAELVSNSLGMLKENVAISGTSTVDWLNKSGAVTRNWNDFREDYDLITVMLGTNDQGYNLEVGTIASTGTGTYYARLKTIYEELRTRYPKSVIAFITPIKRYKNNGDLYTNALGLSTEPYAQAVRDVCALYSVPCIDIYNAIDPSTQTARDNFFIESGGSHDGTHPNDVGHALFIAPIVEARLREIAPFYFNEWT